MNFLIVFESIWNNKQSKQSKTRKLGTDIVKLVNGSTTELSKKQIESKLNLEKLNSSYPYDTGTFGPGFNDIEFVEDDKDETYIGRVMIFELENNFNYRVTKIRRRRLSDKDILYIRKTKGTHNTKELAVKFKVSRSLISKIRNNKLYKDV